MDREKVIKGLEHCSSDAGCKGCPYGESENGHVCSFSCIQDALVLLKEQEDGYKNILSDYEDLAREHEKLLDKKIPLITNGQEVVRCKDCKHRLECDYWIENGDDWFCADGERRSDYA